MKIDDRVEQDDIVILKQSDFDENEVTAVKLGEVGGLGRECSSAGFGLTMIGSGT